MEGDNGPHIHVGAGSNKKLSDGALLDAVTGTHGKSVILVFHPAMQLPDRKSLLTHIYLQWWQESILGKTDAKHPWFASL